MRQRDYGQFCGLSRAAEIVGQRWALHVLRELLVAPQRYSDLAANLPGIPSNVLATRLKELEAEGIVERRPVTEPRGVVYTVTERGRAIEPALVELGRWGAATMTEPREGEVVTSSILAMALRTAFQRGAVKRRRSPVVFQVGAGPDVLAHAVVTHGTVETAPGPHLRPDLSIVAGPSLRLALAGRLTAAELRRAPDVSVEGERGLLAEFLAQFRVPLDATVAPGG